MFLDPKTNELKGLEPDIAKCFAKELGVKCDIVQAEWDALIPGLLADKWDIIIANMNRLPSRAASVDFTLAYENYDGCCLAVRKSETKITGWNSLGKGVKIGTGRGNSAEAYAMKTWPDATFVPFASPQLAVQALIAGQLDVVIEDYTGMLGFQAQTPKIKLLETDNLRALNCTGFAVKPGNSRLLLWANIFLTNFKLSGDYAKVYHRWFPTVKVSEHPFEVIFDK